MNRSLRLLFGLALALVLVSRATAVPILNSSVPIGARPVAVAVDPSTHRVYVADEELGEVVQYEGERNSVSARIRVDGFPASLAVDSQGRRLFVGSRDDADAAITVIDTATGRARAFPSGGRVWGLAFDAEVNRLYAGDPDNNELLVIDGASGDVLEQVPLSGTPVAVAVNASDGEVAVAVQGTAPALVLLDPTDLETTPVAVSGGQPLHVAVDTSTGKFFVTRGGSNPALLVLRPGASSFDNEIPIEPGPTGLAIDSRNSRIYLAHAANLATVIDGATGRPVSVLPLPIGDVANHIAVDTASTPTRVYIVDTAGGMLSILTDQ